MFRSHITTNAERVNEANIIVRLLKLLWETIQLLAFVTRCVLDSCHGTMEAELQKYEQLANPTGSKELKSKAPSILSTLAELRQQLELAREQFLLQPDASVSQPAFMKITGNIDSAKAKIDERLKETHASGTKIAKLVDKVITCLLNGKQTLKLIPVEKPHCFAGLSAHVLWT